MVSLCLFHENETPGDMELTSHSFTGCLMSAAQVFCDLINEVLKGGKRKILICSGMARKGLTNEMACGCGAWTFLQKEYHVISYRSMDLGVRGGRWAAKVGGSE